MLSVLHSLTLLYLSITTNSKDPSGSYIHSFSLCLNFNPHSTT